MIQAKAEAGIDLVIPNTTNDGLSRNECFSGAPKQSMTSGVESVLVQKDHNC